MAINRIQFQLDLSLPEFLAQFGTDERCANALEASRWPQGFRCPACGNAGRCSENKVPFVAAISLSAEGRKPKDLPEFNWINMVLGNLKTSMGGAYHAFDFAKYGTRYLSAFVCRFKRRFHLVTLSLSLLVAAATIGLRSVCWLRQAEESF